MDPYQYAKEAALGIADKFKNLKEQAGLGLRHAAGQIGEDLTRGAAIANDPRNAWIGMNPVGRVGIEGLALAGKGLSGLGLAGITLYHGSPHRFDRFSLDKIGTGEGVQAYGHGLYFAENPRVAKSYANPMGRSQLDMSMEQVNQLYEDSKLFIKPSKTPYGWLLHNENSGYPIAGTPYYQSREEALRALDNPTGHLREEILKQFTAPEKWMPMNEGQMYHVEIPDEAVSKMLEWDKPLSEQPWAVRRALEEFKDLTNLDDGTGGIINDPTGSQIYDVLGGLLRTGPDGVSEELKKRGIPGIKYLDAMSRGTGEKGATYNYVVFDDELPVIKKKE